MWEYNHIYENEYLEHGIISDTVQKVKKKYKYIAKVKKGKKTRYFYTQEAYDAYLKKVKQSIVDLTEKTKDFLEDAIDKGEAFIDYEVRLPVRKITVRTTNKVSYFLNNFRESIIKTKAEKEHKYLYKEKLPNGKYRYFYDEQSHDSYMKKLEYQKNEPDFMKNVPETKDLIDDSADVPTPEDDMAEINEKYYRGAEYRYNCMRCTTAYELRRRGYDVEAGPTTNGHKISELNDWYENPKIYKVSDQSHTAKNLENAIVQTSGKNSRGNLMVYWTSGGGHSMAYEVDEKGNFTIRDCQTNDAYTAESFLKIYEKYVTDAYFVRTDNLELKEGVLKLVNNN